MTRELTHADLENLGRGAVIGIHVVILFPSCIGSCMSRRAVNYLYVHLNMDCEPNAKEEGMFNARHFSNLAALSGSTNTNTNTLLEKQFRI
jgi:hypothetical protein